MSKHINLLLLPHAGGSAKGYCVMKRFFPENISLVPLDPSGKGLRTKDVPCSDIPSCVADIIDKNKQYFHEPYAVFGHSMGTLLAVEMMRQVHEKGLSEPEHIFFSGRCSADEKGAFPVNDSNSDDEITAFFVENGLIPEQVLNNKPLLEMFSQILCRDIRLTQKYTISPEKCRVNCNISVMYGTEDTFLNGFDMNNWGRFTSGKCTLYQFSGGHFYYTSQQKYFCECITKELV